MTPRLPAELKSETVPVQIFQDRFLHLRDHEDWTLSDLARRLEWYDRGRPDISRVRHYLGLSSYRSNGYDCVRQRVTYATAVKLCRALDLDPVDCGI